jgi:predicted O-linked N-acetylglucosamine transferase (SPINDLY family)
VPVVSLVGATAVGRAGLSILSNAGLPELAADDTGEFVRRASELAADLPRLEKMRRGLRQRMLDSPLTDARGFAAAVESAFRRMWSEWCSKGD